MRCLPRGNVGTVTIVVAEVFLTVTQFVRNMVAPVAVTAAEAPQWVSNVLERVFLGTVLRSGGERSFLKIAHLSILWKFNSDPMSQRYDMDPNCCEFRFVLAARRAICRLTIQLDRSPTRGV